MTYIAHMNAELVVDAEKYYTAMFNPEENSWNVRDRHFFRVLEKVLGHFERTRGHAQAVVWAHNSHIGDARFAHLDASRCISGGRDSSIGKLIKEHYRDVSLLVGMLTYHGDVMAADDWGGRPKKKMVRNALSCSYEELLKRLSERGNETDFFLDLRVQKAVNLLEDASGGSRLERAIGVIYRPQTERMSHYYFSDVAKQFDLLCFIRRTKAVEPLDEEEG